MRSLFVLILVAASPLSAATKYFINSGNWGTATNWASACGGSHTTETVPTASDAVIFCNLSGNVTIDTSGRTALTLDFSNGGTNPYTGTVTMTNTITVSGSVTLTTGMAITGAAALIVNATATVTSGGKAWPNQLVLSGGTETLGDSWTVGSLKLGATSVTQTVNANGITVNGNLDLSGSSTGSIGGTTTITIANASTITFPSSTGVYSLTTTINATGQTITFPTGTFRLGGGTFTYTAGTLSNVGNVDIAISGTSTLNTGGASMVFHSITLSGASQTYTLSSDLNTAGDLLLQATVSPVINGSNINFSGNMTVSGSTTGTYTGTTILNAKGTGAVSWSGVTTGLFKPAIHVNTSGTITFSGYFPMDGSKFTCSSGTIVSDTTWTCGGGGSGGQRAYGSGGDL